MLVEIPYRGNDLRNKLCIGDGRKLDKPDTVRKFIKQIRGDLQAEARLAGAAYAGQCQQAMFTESLCDRRDFLFAPYEAGKELRERAGAYIRRGGSSGAHARNRTSKRRVKLTRARGTQIWNNFFLPLVMLQNDDLFPVSLGLFAWNTQYYHAPQLRLLVIVGSMVAIIPVILTFLILQRYWRAGLAEGSIK